MHFSKWVLLNRNDMSGKSPLSSKADSEDSKSDGCVVCDG